MSDESAFEIGTHLVEPHLPELVQMRRTVHQNPETAHQEKGTARRVADFLSNSGADDVQTGIGGTGVIATYKGSKDGPVVMCRAELDGLPIQEDASTAKGYQSKRDGKMHACGHDGHLTMVAGIGTVLQQLKPRKGTVKLLFQPAEETGEGALKMIEDEVFADHQPDWIYGLHNLPGYPKHQVIIREGVFAAASVGIRIRLKGATAHAAHPEQGRSPAQAMAQLISLIESLPQRVTSLGEVAKATVIHAKLGEEAFGTSPGEAVVMATLRSYQNETLQKLKQHAKQEAETIAQTADLECTVEWTEPFSATTAESQAVERIRKAAEANGFDVIAAATPFAWSEDFGQFTDRYPGAFFGLGSGIQQPPLHASNYDFPDELISTGVRLFLSIIAQHNGFTDRTKYDDQTS